MVDGINIPTFVFDDFTPECILCPIIAYTIMSDTQLNINSDLIFV
jgi:hypothetical protein